MVVALLLAPAVRAESPRLTPKQTAALVVLYEGDEPEADFIARLRSDLDDPSGDVSATLFFVIRESIEQRNEDKRQWISKLAGHPQIEKLLSDYLQALKQAIQQLGCAAARQPGCGDGIATAETALRAFGSRIIATRDVPLEAVRDLRTLAQRDRRLFARARRLEQLANKPEPAAAPSP